MRAIWTIAKKEIKAIVTNKQLLLQITIVPFLFIFGFMLMSAVMMDSALEDPSEKEFIGYYINTPEYFQETFDSMGLKSTTPQEVENIKTQIADKEVDILIVFPEDFELSMDGENLDNIEMWYNSRNTNSITAQSMIVNILDSTRPITFTININSSEEYDLGEYIDPFTQMLQMIFSVYSIMALFMAIQALAAESIVGEKERGFMNLLLITPVKRSHIAIGKLTTIFAVNLISGTAAMIGLVASSVLGKNVVGEMSMQLTPESYLSLFLIMVTCAFALSSIVMLISAVSKTVKQAQTSSAAVLMVVSLAGIFSSGDTGFDAQKILGDKLPLIPCYNGIIEMQNIIAGSVSMNNTLMIVAVNITFALVISLIASRMFENEKIMQN